MAYRSARHRPAHRRTRRGASQRWRDPTSSRPRSPSAGQGHVSRPARCAPTAAIPARVARAPRARAQRGTGWEVRSTPSGRPPGQRQSRGRRPMPPRVRTAPGAIRVPLDRRAVPSRVVPVRATQPVALHGSASILGGSFNFGSVMRLCDTRRMGAMDDLAGRLEQATEAMVELGRGWRPASRGHWRTSWGPARSRAGARARCSRTSAEMLPYWMGEIELILDGGRR